MNSKKKKQTSTGIRTWCFPYESHGPASLVTRLRPENRGSDPNEEEMFLFNIASMSAMESTEPTVQWIQAALPKGQRVRGMMLSIYFRLAPKFQNMKGESHDAMYFTLFTSRMYVSR